MLARWFNCLILGLITLSNFSAGQALAAEKKNVCAMTINSNDEIELFKKHLSKDLFNFIELTKVEDKQGPSSDTKNEADSANAWLKASCRQSIKCDVLVISGHFGGSFFGSSDIKLPLEELEAASCDSECSGILHKPKEVFLFGCNTLAGKEKDARTPQQYVNVLVEDGFTHEQAQQIAAFRYSPMGSSFNDRMSRIFSKVPRIYGFSSIAPSGKTIAPHLGGYLKETAPTYFEKLTKMATEPNTSLISRLKGQPFVQTKGADSMDSPVCYIENQNSSTIAKLKYTLEILNKGGVLELAPYLGRYFSQLDQVKLNPAERRLLHEIHSHEAAREKLETFVAKPIIGLLKPQIDTLLLMLSINWISQSKYEQSLESWVLNPLYKASTLTRAITDSFCSLGVQTSHINPQKINSALWNEPMFYQVLSCLNPTNDDFLRAIAKQLENPKNVESILFYIKRTNVASKDIRVALEKLYAKQINPSHSGIAASIKESILLTANKDDAFLISKFEDYLKNPENAEHKYFGYVEHLSEALTHRMGQEILNPQNPETLYRVLSLNPFARSIPAVTRRLHEIIEGDYDIDTQMMALYVLEMKYSTGSEQHPEFLKSVLASRAPYQLKRQVIQKLFRLEAGKYYAEAGDLLADKKEIFLKKTLDLMKELSGTYLPSKLPFHTKFSHDFFLPDVSSTLLKKLNSGEIPYYFVDSDTSDAKGPLVKRTIIIGFNKPSGKNAIYLYEENVVIYNTQSKTLVGLEPFKPQYALNPRSQQFGNLFVSTILMDRTSLINSLLVNDPQTGNLQQDYSSSVFAAQKNLILGLKSQSADYKSIIETNTQLEVGLAPTDANEFKITLLSKGTRETLTATGLLKFTPGPTGLGTVKIEGLEITKTAASK